MQRKLQENKNVNEYYGCEYDNNDRKCYRHENPNVWSGISSNNRECFINRPYLKRDNLNGWDNTVSALKVLSVLVVLRVIIKIKITEHIAKYAPQGKYSDNSGRTSDCDGCGVGKYQNSTVFYFQDFETDAACLDSNNNCEWGCEARQFAKSFNGANDNLICGGQGKKSGNEVLEKTWNSVPAGYYHLDFDYYKVSTWDDNEHGYVHINDISCWRKTKDQFHEGGADVSSRLAGNNEYYGTYARKSSCSIT